MALKTLITVLVLTIVASVVVGIHDATQPSLADDVVMQEAEPTLTEPSATTEPAIVVQAPTEPIAAQQSLDMVGGRVTL